MVKVRVETAGTPTGLRGHELQHGKYYVVVGESSIAAWKVGTVVLCGMNYIYNLATGGHNSKGESYLYREFGPGDKVTIEG